MGSCKLACVMLAVVVAAGCYRSHERPGRSDAGPEPMTIDEPCCLDVSCGMDDCADDEACVSGTCAPRCEGPRCGDGCCDADGVCVAGACVALGQECARDATCGDGWRCEPLVGRCAPEPVARCFAARPMAPSLEWQRPFHSISVPLVAQLGDDDGDGRVGPGDVPDVIALEHPLGEAQRARLAAFSGDDGRLLWELEDRFSGVCSYATAAVADLDGDGTVEILVPGRNIPFHLHIGDDPRLPCTDPPDPGEPPCPPFPSDREPIHEHGNRVDARIPSQHFHAGVACTTFDEPPDKLLVVSHEGVVERVIELPIAGSPRAAFTLIVTDLEGDGAAELVVGGSVLGLDGVRWSDERLEGVPVVAGDIDLDGRRELVTARHAFTADGELLWEANDAVAEGHPVIARVAPGASSGPPQVVVIDGGLMVARDGATGRVVLGPARFGSGVSSGAPVIADFDGDGASEIAVAGDGAFTVFDPELPPPHVLWTLTSQDETTGTVGASAYDFDADGADDIAYSDECRVTILSGRDGTPRWVASNPSLTLFEYPVVADVDADGEAELAVVGNRRYFEQIGELGCPGRLDPWMGANGGLRVYGDTLDAWGPTRATWDQHTYVADALADDGTVPAEVTRPWDEHNTVRANPRPVGDRTPLPDLRVGALRARYAETCGRGPLRVEAQIENRGMVAVAAGVTVRFGAVTSRTTAPLLPGAAEWVVSPPIRRDGVDGALTVTVDADVSVTECHEANAASLTVRCR